VADGKVLTKYAARLDGRDVYIIRSQSVLDPAVQSLSGRSRSRSRSPADHAHGDVADAGPGVEPGAQCPARWV